MFLKTEPTVKRFFSKIKKSDGCWLWSASLDAYGYGQFVASGWPRKAHRAMFIYYNGPIPKNMLICHSCDVRNCVNPKHLFLGTHKDNNQDRSKKIAKCKNGHSYSKENTYINSKGHRSCKICRRLCLQNFLERSC